MEMDVFPFAVLPLPDAGFLELILAGDPATIEVALCFQEARPYFFRSGYHWKTTLLFGNVVSWASEIMETDLRRDHTYRVSYTQRMREQRGTP